LIGPLLRSLRTPSLVLVLALFAAACATAPARPPVSIGTGQPRVDPITGERIVEPGREGEAELEFAEDGGLTPPFMSGRDIKRAAVLLPFSHPNAQVRAEAENMLAGIELALFENANDNFLIMPLDTGGRASTAEARADEAIAEGADIVLGPLFAANLASVRNAAQRAGLPVIAFSNDRDAAGGGVFLSSILPEEEVRRIMAHAAGKGARSFVYLGPESAYGRQVERAMQAEAARNSWEFAGSFFYEPSTSAADAARRAASAVLSASRGRGRSVAVMMPERGVNLLALAPLLVVNGVDPTRTFFIGTSLWEDATIWREPALAGGLYPVPDPDRMLLFQQAYQRIYGRVPTDLAAVAYDAASVAISLAAENNLSYGGVTDPAGFFGVNGLFRFRPDGTTERGLAVKEIRGSGAVVVERALTRFPATGT
jgi:hypothetical protein